MPTPEKVVADAAEAAMTPEEREAKAAAEAYHSLKNVVQLLKPQFVAMGLPPTLYAKAYRKIYGKIYDAPSVFQVQYVEDEGFRVVCNKEGGLKKNSDVFVIDHAWTTTHELLIPTLCGNPDLTDRLWEMLDVERRQAAEAQAAHVHAEEVAYAHAQAANGGVEAIGAVTASEADSDAKATPEEEIVASEHDAVVREQLRLAQLRAYTPDPEQVALLVEQTGCQESQAVTALRYYRGDMVLAMVSVQGGDENDTAEMERELEVQFAKTMEQQTQYKMDKEGEGTANGAAAAAAGTEAKVEEGSPEELKAKVIKDTIFRCKYARSYNIAQPRAEDSTRTGPLQPDEVTTCIYVNDEIGSSIQPAMHKLLANANLANVIVITLGGMAFSLLWPTKDIAFEEEVTVPEYDKAIPPPLQAPEEEGAEAKK